MLHIIFSSVLLYKHIYVGLEGNILVNKFQIITCHGIFQNVKSKII